MKIRLAILALFGACSAFAEPGPMPRELHFDSNGFVLPRGAIRRLGIPPAFRGSSWSLAWTADGKRFVAADWNGYTLFDAGTGKPIEAFTSFPSEVPSFGTIVRDGRSMLRLKGGGPVGALCNLETGETIAKIKLPSPLGDAGRRFYSLDMSNSHRFLVGIASADSMPGVAWRYDLARNRYIRLITDRADLLSVRISPDGKRVYATGGTADPELTARNLANGKELWTVPLKGTGKLHAVSAQGNRLAVLDLGGLAIIDAETGKSVVRLPINSQRSMGYWTVDLSPDGNQVAFTDEGTVVEVWNTVTGKSVLRLPQTARYIAFSPDGQALLTGGDWIQKWDLKTGTAMFPEPYLARCAGPEILHWSADGKRLLSAWAEEKRLALWDIATSNRIWNESVESPVECAHVDPHGERVRVFLENGVVRGWNTKPPDEPTVGLARFQQQRGANDASFLDDGRLVLHVLDSNGGRFEQYSPAGKLERSHVKHRDSSYDERGRSGSYRAEGTTLVGPGGWRYDVLAQRDMPRLQGGASFRVMSFLPSPSRAILAGRTIEGSEIGRFVWESLTGSVITQLPLSIPPRSSLSPDGQFLAVYSDRGVTLHNLNDAKLDWSVTKDSATSVAFSPDGSTLAVGISDGTVLLWPVPRRASSWNATDLDTHWKRLELADAAPAWRSLWHLLEHPAEASDMLATRVLPAQSVKDTPQWIAKLDDGKFAIREEASKVLTGRGSDIERDLIEALKSPRSEEQRARLERLIAKLDPATPPTGDVLRNLRCVWLLERIGSAKAVALLERLAGGASGSRVTFEAKQAVRRLAATR